jgi:hypothetical protein
MVSDGKKQSKKKKMWGWSLGLLEIPATVLVCFTLFRLVSFFFFGIADALSACLSLLVSSYKPHHQFPPRSAQTAWHQIFLVSFL